mmetsp:Transcript_19057/g.27808  ORF Transcript_19057/g.27808 Transcript_19057/m.27808 type:complete len:123 (+) Transcript_19057:38-406(+)
MILKDRLGLTQRQKNLWGLGFSVIAAGSLIKFGYFYLSREMIIENLERRDKEARKYLKESENFGNWAAQDRQKRLTPLTNEQRDQMQSYLLMMAQSNKDVYPTTSYMKGADSGREVRREAGR